MKNIFALTIVALAVTGCKSTNRSESSVKAIGQQGQGIGIVVFHLDGGVVYKRDCADYAASAAPSKCPVQKSMPWSEFSNKLEAAGLASSKVFELKDFLADPDMKNAASPAVAPYLPFIDSVLGGTTQGTANVTVPPPSGTNNPLAKAQVLAAMEQIRTEQKMDLNSYVIPCLANDTPHWSDIVIHYYCQLGAPRQCFTPKARQFTKDLAGYTRAYNECETENDFTFVARKQPDMFRYIMYSVYTSGGVNTFTQEDQDEVINKFYGVTDPTNPSDCGKRPRRKNESRAAGKHCTNASAPAVGGGGTPTGSSVVLKTGFYKITRNPNDLCKQDQYIEPNVAGGVMTSIRLGWCGSAYSETFTCSGGNKCTGNTNKGPNTGVITVTSTTKYEFDMPGLSGTHEFYNATTRSQ